MRTKAAISLGLVIGTLLIFLNVLSASQEPNANYPCPVHVESLDYPKVARAARVSGKVALRLRISEMGKVDSVESLSGPAILAEEARRNALTWVFATRKASSIDVTYEFRLENPPTEKDVNPTVKFDLPDHVLILSRERETIVN